MNKFAKWTAGLTGPASPQADRIAATEYRAGQEIDCVDHSPVGRSGCSSTRGIARQKFEMVAEQFGKAILAGEVKGFWPCLKTRNKL